MSENLKATNTKKEEDNFEIKNVMDLIEVLIILWSKDEDNLNSILRAKILATPINSFYSADKYTVTINFVNTPESDIKVAFWCGKNPIHIKAISISMFDLIKILDDPIKNSRLFNQFCKDFISAFQSYFDKVQPSKQAQIHKMIRNNRRFSEVFNEFKFDVRF